MLALVLSTLAAALFVDSRESAGRVSFGAEAPEGWEEAWLKLSRPLHAFEIEAAQEVLGDTVPYDLVRVVETDKLSASGHTASRMEQRYFVIRMNPRQIASADADLLALKHMSARHAYLAVLVHELAHVSQLLEFVPGGTYSDAMRAYMEQLHVDLSKREAFDRYNWRGRVKLQIPWSRWPWEARADFIAGVWQAARRYPGKTLGFEYAPYLEHVPVVPLEVSSVTTVPGWAIQDLDPLESPFHMTKVFGEPGPERKAYDSRPDEPRYPEGLPEYLVNPRAPISSH